MNEITVILADRQRLFTEGLRCLLEKYDGIRVVGICENEMDTYAFSGKIKPGLLLIDIDFSQEMSRLLKRIYENNPNEKVIVLSSEKDIDKLFDIYTAGIAGYVLKTSDVSVLVKAINVVNSGGQYIEPVVIPALKEKIDSMDKDYSNRSFLTGRELQILQYVAQGLYNKEIAYNLGIKEKTVKNHITHLFKKIGVEDRIQAAVYALRNGYIHMD